MKSTTTTQDRPEKVRHTEILHIIDGEYSSITGDTDDIKRVMTFKIDRKITPNAFEPTFDPMRESHTLQVAS